MDDFYVCRLCNIPHRSEDVRIFSFGCICKDCLKRYFVPIDLIIGGLIDGLKLRVSRLIKFSTNRRYTYQPIKTMRIIYNDIDTNLEHEVP